MKHTILIDLDVLLDTRLATLTRINDEEALRLLLDGWTHRQTDDLTNQSEIISNEEFKKAYANRDIETLKSSRITSYVFELSDMVEQLAKSIYHDDARIKEANVVINHYPYKDLDSETLQDIVTAVAHYINDILPIQVGYYAPDDLDLRALKKLDILTYVTYDFQTWFESSFNVKKGKAAIVSYPKLTIVAPQIMPNNNSFDNLDVESRKLLQDKTPFEFMKMYWAPMFGIEYCPIELMSLIDVNILKDES